MAKTWSSMVVTLLFCYLFLSGFAVQGFAQPDHVNGTIVDASGRTIKIPRNIKKIVVTCYGGASHELSVLGVANKIVAQPTMQRFPQLLAMYPVFAQLPDAGSFETASIEKILSLSPDLVIAGITSPKSNKKIEDTGIPVVIAAIGRADIDGLLKEFKMMGKLLGSEKNADALVAYWEEHLSFVKRKIGGVPEKNRQKVFYMSSPLPLNTEGGLWWGHHYISVAGGINVASSLRSARQITQEQLLVWNPDVIVMHNDRNPTFTAAAVKTNPQMKHIKAVKDGKVYVIPNAAFWWDRPSPEAILGILWLAKTLYPDLMRECDLRKETVSFYKTFYNYKLSDAEYKAFFR